MASVILSFGGKEINSYELTKPATVVGRDPGVDIVIDNLGVSRSHCQLIQRGAGYVVQDMNSANGTYVNGTRVGEQGLSSDDQIVVGKYVLTFKAGAEQAAAEALAAPAAPGAPEGAKAVPAAGPVIPDALNTYMMDGDKIKERLEEMRRKEQTASQQPAAQAPASGGEAAPPPPAAESAPAHQEHHTRIVMGTAQGGGGGTNKRYLYISWVLIGLLILILIVLAVFTLKNA
jgi:pSer/pThr/pTyr-binding forkhead associated (FHA) protein